MHIQAAIPGYKQTEVELNPDKRVSELKKAVCRKLGIEPELTRLLLNGKQLRENLPLSKLRPFTATITVDYLWSRQLLVWGSEGQSKLRNATVLLAGAGAIGNEAAKNLAMLGVGEMLIADLDQVEMSNVSRMIFFKPKDLGKNKAEVLAENIHAKYPHVETTAYRGRLESMPLKLYLDSQVVVCGLDNVVSRIFLTQTCRKYNIPLIDAGIIGLTGRVHSYIPPDDTCPICLFPPNQYSNIVGLRNPCEARPDEQAVPSFSTSISLVSSIQAQETIKVIQGIDEYRARKKWPETTGEPLRATLFLDLKNNRYAPMKVDRNPRCIVCGKDGTARETANRSEVSREELSRQAADKTIRRIANLHDENITFYLESSHGTAKMDGYSPIRRQARRGDYLRILSEAKNGELHESILRLI
jgi:adenylyltransferase/sulfurtransferase